MKRFKKFLGMFLALAMVAGMIGMMPVVEAKAAGPTVVFDSKTNLLTITDNSKSYVYIGEAKKDAVKTYSVFEISSTNNKIDLSAYAKKGVELWIHFGDPGTNNVDVTKLKIAKSDKKLKVTLALEKPKVNERFVITNNGAVITLPETSDTTNNKIQFRLDGDTEWKEACGGDTGDLAKAIKQIEQYGAVIYFREIGKGLPSATATPAECMFASAEAKVKYPKLGKAPTITVDYVKNTVKFPKGVKVQTASTDFSIKADGSTFQAEAAWADFTPSKDAAVTLSIDKIIKAAATTKTAFYVRTAANGKKPSSSITAVSVEAKATKPAVYLKPTSTPPALGAEIERVTKSATDNSTKGIKITNKSEAVLEYVVLATGTTPVDSTKWTKLGGKDATKTLSATSMLSDIYVRVAGAKPDTKATTPTSGIRVSIPSDKLELKFGIQSGQTVTVTAPTGCKSWAEVKTKLPTKVAVTLVDGTKVDLPVTTWSTPADGTNSGSCTATIGTLAGITGTAPSVSVTVTITPPTT